MAQELKVGDRVRITGSRWPNDAWIGMEAEVTTAPRTAGAMHDRKTFLRPLGKRPWGEGNFWWTTDHLEKIDPEPKFKVGDRALDHKYSGKTVTVVATRGYPAWPIRVRYADGSLRLRKESELAKIESVPFKLERGDRVVNIKTGREGEVVHDLVFDAKPPFGNPVPVKAIEEYEEHHPGTYDLIKAKAPW